MWMRLIAIKPIMSKHWPISIRICLFNTRQTGYGFLSNNRSFPAVLISRLPTTSGRAGNISGIQNSVARGSAAPPIPNDRFGRVFFQPLYAGQTFGLGQLNPLTALKVTDIVNRTSRLRRLKASNAPQFTRP